MHPIPYYRKAFTMRTITKAIQLASIVSRQSASCQAKEAVAADEIAVMDGSKCILQVRGERPFLSSKYNIEKHPNYRFLADHDPKHTFDVNKYLSSRLKLRKDDVYAVAEIDMSAETLE